MNIRQIQDKLLAYHAQSTSKQEVYEVLGFKQWSDYHAIYEQIWTPQFRYRIYMLGNPDSTLEQAFCRAFLIGWKDGFDDGYNAALEDMQKGTHV